MVIGITACTREAIVHLLKRIEKVQKEHGMEDLFSILYVASQSPFDGDSSILTESYDKVLTKKNKIKKESSIRVFVVGATVWHWVKVLKSRKRFLGCDMMILDESTQVNTEKITIIFVFICTYSYLCLTQFWLFIAY